MNRTATNPATRYEAPLLERLEVNVEQGFSLSDEYQLPDYEGESY